MTEVMLDKPKTKSSLGRWIPLALFVLIALFLGKGLFMDPSRIPSVLIGKPVPEFGLPPVEGRKLGLATADLKEEVSVVNFFASWCTACRAEHPLLMRLAASGVVPTGKAKVKAGAAPFESLKAEIDRLLKG
jgi:cytochrome c biogenesis protein CcmG/thiol:disulfide interchange protein DsbE